MKGIKYALILLTHLISTSIMAEFNLSSSGFKNLEQIPEKHTCLGKDESPDLSWTNPPLETQSFALCIEDPDAPQGLFIHWIAYNIPKNITNLPSNIETTPVTIHGICQGINDFGNVGYGGPCPPPQQKHRYIFTLYALDARLNLPPLATYASFKKTIEPHILGKAELTGLFK